MFPTRPFETSRGARLIVVCIGLVWVGIACGDWFMRLTWFKWHERLVIRPRSPFAAPYRPLENVLLPVSRGGDLSRLVGIPGVAARFEEERESVAHVTDEFGFLNLPSVAQEPADIVVVGDSYMVTGPGTTNAFPSQLASVSSLRVYNYAYAGMGSMWSPLRFLLSDGIRERKPKVVLWGLIEREIAGGYFAGVRAQLHYFDRVQREGPGLPYFNWSELGAKGLRKSLPNTSLFAQLSGRTWTIIRYYTLGRMNSALTESGAIVPGESMLLYVPSIDAMRWDENQRYLLQVADIVKLLHEMTAQHGAELVLLLIPDKERIFEDLIPDRYRDAQPPLRPAILPDLVELLRAEGILAINLLPRFQQARREGHRLYWRDDTHWRPEGIRLAAEVTWRELAPWWQERFGAGRQVDGTTGRQDCETIELREMGKDEG